MSMSDATHTMTAADFDAWRQSVGHATTTETAEALGVTRRMVEMYRSGKRPVSATVERLCAALSRLHQVERAMGLACSEKSSQNGVV